MHKPGVRFCLAHIARLPPDMADAIGLVLGQGFSYDEAAAFCACSPGPMKAASAAPAPSSSINSKAEPREWRRAPCAQGIDKMSLELPSTYKDGN